MSFRFSIVDINLMNYFYLKNKITPKKVKSNVT